MITIMVEYPGTTAHGTFNLYVQFVHWHINITTPYSLFLSNYCLYELTFLSMYKKTYGYPS